MEKPLVDILKNKFTHRTAHILGSGPSLPETIGMIQPGEIIISVNLKPVELKYPDVIVCLDREAAKRAWEWEIWCDVISPFLEYSNFTWQGHIWDAGMTAPSAVYIALLMGCNPVVLHGMDCFQGKAYFNSAENHPCQNTPLENHLNTWKKAFSRCSNPERIRAASGPLAEIFGSWK